MPALPTLTSTIELQELASVWAGHGDTGALAQAAREAPHPVQNWRRWHRLGFLDALLEHQLAQGAAEAIDEAYCFSQSQDRQELIRWAKVLALPRCAELMS